MKEFRKYFGGLERDFGFCNVNNGYHDPQTNKLKFDPGDYGWSKRNISDQDYQDHLDGKDPALGVIPINENNSCRWGCIDVDEYNLDHKKLAASIKSHKFPLVMFRSKSGGAHLFLI